MVTKPLVVFAEIPVPPVTPLTGKFWYVVADIVVDVVVPVTVRVPFTVRPVTVLNNTLKVPPVLFVYVNVLLEYVAPVTLISVGKFWYVVAEIVFAVKPPVKLVAPVTVPPVNVELVVIPVTLNVPPELFLNIMVLPL